MSRLAKVIVLFVSLIGLGTWGGNATAAIRTSTATGGTWATGATWVGGVAPVATDSAVIATGATVTLGAAASIIDVTVSTGATLSLATFGLASSGNIGNSGIITATSTAGILASTGAAAIISGTNGTYSGTVRLYTSGTAPSVLAGSTLNFTGTSQIRAGLTAAGATITGSVLNINGTLTSTQAAGTNLLRLYANSTIVGATGIINAAPSTLTYNTAAATLTNNGSVTIQTVTGNAVTSIWTNAASSTLNVRAALLATGVLNASAAGNTVNYNGTAAAQAIKAPSAAGYANLTLSGSLAKTTAANLLINGDLTLSNSATFTAGTSLIHTIAGSFIINTSAATPFTWTTASTFNFNTPAPIAAATSIGGTTTATLAFNTVNINNTSGVNLVDNASFSGTLTIGAGATLTPAAAAVVSGAGTLTGSGTVQVTRTAATADFSSQYIITNKTLTGLTVEYIGGGQTVGTTLITYPLLKISNTVTLSANTTVSTLLTLNSGDITTGANSLIVATTGTISGGSSSSYVFGNLRKNFAAGATTITFPIGDSTNYTPVAVSVAGAALNSDMTASTTAGDHPNIASSALVPALTANRYWTLASTTVPGTYSAAFTFINPGDLDPGTDPANNFEVQRFSGGTWNNTTLGTHNSTSTQATGLTLVGAFAVGERKVALSGTQAFNAYDHCTSGCGVSGFITTKIAGTAFSALSPATPLDIVAVNSAGTLIETTFKGFVKTELVDATTGGGVCASMTSIQTLSPNTEFLAAELGRKQNISFTENNAWPNVKVRITYPSNGIAPLTVTCSTDAFAIRPASLTINSVQDLDWASAFAGVGTARDLYNSNATGGVVHKAGKPFTLTATAKNSLGNATANYAGSPTAVAATCSGAGTACTSIFGTVTPGTWSALNGVVTMTNASYSDVGAFGLQLQDTTFAAIDSSDGVSTAAQMNIPLSVKVDIGRFVPDHFDVTVLTAPTFKTFNVADAACSTGAAPRRTFTYIGQPFGYLTAPQATILARNFAGTTTANYKGSLWKVTASDISQAYSNNTVGPSLDTSLIGTPSVTDNSDGTGMVSSAAADKLAYQRSTAAPSALFNANLSLTVSAQDATENAANQGIITSSTMALFNGGGTGIAFDGGGTSNGKEFRYGRLKLSNAYGSELLNLPVPIQTQYWNNTAFVTNTADNCTTLVQSNINLTSPPLGVSAIVGGAFSSGVGSLTLTKPTPAAKGVVDVCVDLDSGVGGDTTCQATTPATKLYLQTGTAYNKDPTARATFGVYKGSNQFIYMRENY